MTDFSDFKAQIAEWANRQDWSDALVTGFVRMAEEKFNQELRVDRMISWVENQTTMRCAGLPDDWLALDLVLVQNSNGASGLLPARYKSRDEFFTLTDQNAWMYYTLEGRTIFFGGTPDETDGVDYRIAYFAEVPVFADTTPSWLYAKYPSLYLYAALMHADLHAVGEEDKAAGLKALVESQIQKLNQAYLLSKASGSRVTRTRVRSFG
jgi:hypothetical protein